MDKPKKYRAHHLDSGTKKFTKPRMHHTQDWALYRVKFISANPKCYCCGEPARVVDHIESAKGREDLFWKVDNYLPLCKPCHDYATAKFDRHAVALLKEKLEWIELRRQETGTNTRVRIVPFE